MENSNKNNVGDILNEDLFESSESDNEELSFDEEDIISDVDINDLKNTWKLLVVDDDEDIHSVTRLALDNFEYNGKKVQFLDTYSGEESKKILIDNKDIAVILLDVVMESTHAGLDLVKYIRTELKSKLPRIILRTGQPGQAPEKEVIHKYEINDYKTKTELTANKLFTVILASLRTYEALIEVEESNRRLEEKVKERTKEITDSIRYACRIQNAILPELDELKNVFSDCFIFYKPYDIVSGDFYWLVQKERKTFFAVADCTGHGVPGAFMSMLGVAFLNEIVNNNKYIPANEILNELRIYVIKALQQQGREGDTKDGMDISIIIYEKEFNKIQFAGANNPIYVLRNGDITEHKGDRMPIGYYEKTSPFVNNDISLEPDDLLYMLSDGFPDQFGGPKGKKFMYMPLKRLIEENSSKSMSEQKKVLESTLEGWMNYENNKYEQVDDITIVGIKI